MSSMNKILVTGGAGYIGSHTVVALFEAGFKPIIIDNFDNSQPSVIDALRKLTNKDLVFYEGDVSDSSFLQKVWDKEKPDSVIHFAAKKAVGESVDKPLLYYRNNLAGLITLLEFMADNGCKNIVFSSSCTVYGEPDQCPVTESTPQKTATSPYGATKQMSERILQDTAATGKLNVVALRYFNPVGAHPSGLIGELPIGKPNNLVPYLTQAVAGKQEPLVIFGKDYNTPDGTTVRDFIHVMDLAEAHVAAVKLVNKKNTAPFVAFNVGTGNGSSVLELIKAFQKTTGVNVPYTFGPRRAGDVAKIWADVSLATKSLNWRATRTLEQSMADAWNWQKQLG